LELTFLRPAVFGKGVEGALLRDVVSSLKSSDGNVRRVACTKDLFKPSRFGAESV